jgi:ectoine hydroxylase-related dioxygenase (phytanoyl-CoA dioxygenase family)
MRKMLTQEQIDFFDRNGYLKVGRVLDDAQVEVLRERLDDVMAGRSAGQPELLRNLAGGGLDTDAVVVQIVNIWSADDQYRALMFHPAITEMTAELTRSDTLRVWHDQIQYKPPRVGTSTRWHQDFPAWPNIYPGDMVTAWVALDDVTIATGCLRFVPGSHHWGVHRGLGTEEDFAPKYDAAQLPAGAEVRVECVEVMKGECNFHHCLTWHGSAPNATDFHRRAIAIHYMPAHIRYTAAGGHPMKQRVTVAEGEILEGAYFPTVYHARQPVGV